MTLLVLVKPKNYSTAHGICFTTLLCYSKSQSPHYLLLLTKTQSFTQTSALVVIVLPEYRSTISGDRYDTVVYLCQCMIHSYSTFNASIKLNQCKAWCALPVRAARSSGSSGLLERPVQTGSVFDARSNGPLERSSGPFERVSKTAPIRRTRSNGSLSYSAPSGDAKEYLFGEYYALHDVTYDKRKFLEWEDENEIKGKMFSYVFFCSLLFKYIFVFNILHVP